MDRQSSKHPHYDAIESLPQPYAKYRQITDTEGNPVDIIFLQLNCAFERVTGIKRKEVIGRKASDVLSGIGEDELAWIKKFCREADGNANTTVVHYSSALASWYEVKTFSDEPGYVTALIEDVTEKKHIIDTLERQNARMNLLLEVSSTIAEHKGSSLLSQTIVDGIAKLTDMKSAAIYLIQDGMLRLEAAFPPLPEGFPEDLRIADIKDHPHIMKAVTEMTPVILRDSRQDELTDAEKEVCELRGLRSILYVPLVYQGKCIGVMIPSSVGEVFDFTGEIIELCRVLAAQSALSIAEARTAKERERYIEEIERKNAELELAWKEIQDREKQLSDILRYADAVSFITTDADMKNPRILDFSPGAEKIFGYTKVEVLGKPVGILHTPEEVSQFPGMLKTIADKHREFSGESMLIRKNGEKFPALFKVHPILGEDGNFLGTISVSIDITERKQAEEKHAELQAQLAQSQKMEAIGKLAGGVAHDFNNMLNVILGYSEMIMERTTDTDPLLHELREIHNAAERSARLTKQLLAFARQQAAEPRIISVNAGISDLLSMLRRLIGEDVNLSWIPGDTAGTLMIDPSQLDQILVNLCVNGREAISDTGTITIETRQVILTEDYSEDHVDSPPGRYNMIVVTDDGSGMDRETLSHCLEPFFTTKSTGTGLGLPTVFGIIKQNNGFINVYSEPGQGTTIKVFLPEAGKIVVEKPLQPGELSSPQKDGLILLVDDDEMVRNLTEKMLTQLGFNVYAAASPVEALKIRETTGSISLLITDVVMPEMNGKKLYESLLNTFPNLRCLYMSGYTSNVIVHRGIIDEGVRFLQKPFSRRDLEIKVREILGTFP